MTQLVTLYFPTTEDAERASWLVDKSALVVHHHTGHPVFGPSAGRVEIWELDGSWRESFVLTGALVDAEPRVLYALLGDCKIPQPEDVS